MHPALFARWSHSADGRHWRFEIRQGARFHDGHLCQASDILAFIDGILASRDTFGMPWAYSRYFAQAHFSAGDDFTLLMQSAEPIGDILEIFSEFYICREDPQGLPLLGTGPYRVVDFHRGHMARLQRVSGQGPQQLAFIACATAEERYQLLQQGEVDVATHLERGEARLDFDPRWQWQRRLNTLSVMQYLNCSSGLFSDPRARLAANHALDSQALVNEVLQGLGEPSATVVSPWHTGHRQAGISPLRHDPALARHLLDQVGGCAKVLIRTPLYMPEKAEQISRFVLDSLARVGIEGVLEVQNDRPEYAREIGRKQMGDAAIFDSSPHSTYRILNDKISSTVQGVWWQGFDDPALEPLILAANHSLEPGARAVAYGRCLARLNANPPWLYLFHPHVLFAARHDLAGLSLGAKGDLLIAH